MLFSLNHFFYLPGGISFLPIALHGLRLIGNSMKFKSILSCLKKKKHKINEGNIMSLPLAINTTRKIDLTADISKYFLIFIN